MSDRVLSAHLALAFLVANGHLEKKTFGGGKKKKRQRIRKHSRKKAMDRKKTAMQTRKRNK